MKLRSLHMRILLLLTLSIGPSISLGGSCTFFCDLYDIPQSKMLEECSSQIMRYYPENYSCILNSVPICKITSQWIGHLKVPHTRVKCSVESMNCSNKTVHENCESDLENDVSRDEMCSPLDFITICNDTPVQASTEDGEQNDGVIDNSRDEGKPVWYNPFTWSSYFPASSQTQ